MRRWLWQDAIHAAASDGLSTGGSSRMSLARIVTTTASAAAIVGSLVIGSITTTAQADPIVPTTGAIFNDPTIPSENLKIREYVIDLIDSADTGSTIDVTQMVFADLNVAEALVRADEERDVHVRIVVDDSTPDYADPGPAAYTLLTQEFADFDSLTYAERQEQSWIQTCANERACISSAPSTKNPVNHNKFFLFSAIGGKRVVVNSSENLGNSALWNNAVTVVDDTALFDLFRSYFNELAHADHDIADVYSQFGGTGTTNSSKVWFFPRPKAVGGTEASNDTIGDILANTVCTGTTKIKIGMRNLGDPGYARLRIANELLECADDGATIEIVYNEMEPEFRDVIEQSSRITRFRTSTGPSIHSKYMILDGNFNGSVGKWIFTGSHNYDLDSLRDNDENLLRLKNAAIYDQYAANIVRMKEFATPM